MYVIKDIFGILVITNVNVISLVILMSIQIIKFVSAKKKLVASLIEECTETVEEVKLAKITLTENENSYKCSFCTVYTNVGGIGAYFVHFQWYLKKMLYILTLVLKLKQQITKHINGKY